MGQKESIQTELINRIIDTWGTNKVTQKKYAHINETECKSSVNETEVTEVQDTEILQITIRLQFR